MTRRAPRDYTWQREQMVAKLAERDIRDPRACKAVACPRCGCRNEPGAIACSRCQGPFLLDLARRIDTRPKIRSKLVLGWAMVAGFLIGTVYAWMALEDQARWVAFAAGLALVAGVFTWLFQPRRLGRR